jgi:hypothetical protein
MIMPKDAIVVSDIAGRRAVLKVAGSIKEAMPILSIGFEWDGDTLVRRIVDQADRQELIRKLISFKALFVGGEGWSPADLVEYYREKGLVTGTYLKIIWRSPEEYEITER